MQIFLVLHYETLTLFNYILASLLLCCFLEGEMMVHCYFQVGRSNKFFIQPLLSAGEGRRFIATY
jgi:hypothetical protein